MIATSVFRVINNIRVIREHRNVSKLALSEKLGLSEFAYDLIEQGERKLTLEELFMIAYILDVDYTLLLENNLVMLLT
ncbi:helix-turn-helix transcriptional regulator [Mucilaginibacter sp. SMC90]|uniref:helix-turn-helix transcriptional regulator n=1 Tax=Mucilaginibacter sp. SMC90 TaxID=2929803 RepID=UPI001FB2D844|nr:helix-turn-helix transcriptional regulator [Mucilaginibacter sp. SMC90]UOE50997.1 helix-turn-helix transcriptional regulator [Mucilaginibacter sp. SMC90]